MRVAGRGRKSRAILLIFALEPAGADAKRHAAAADLVDASGDLREMRRIAIGNRRSGRGQPNAAGNGCQRRQHRPAFHERLGRRPNATDLDQVVHHREPNEAVVLGPSPFALIPSTPLPDRGR